MLLEVYETMPTYLVDRELPGITKEQLAEAQKKVVETSQKFSEQGKVVRLMRSTFLPSESRCMCMFEAPSEAVTKEVNEVAQVPFKTITEAIDAVPSLNRPNNRPTYPSAQGEVSGPRFQSLLGRLNFPGVGSSWGFRKEMFLEDFPLTGTLVPAR